ncbi:hypothetical protein [Solibacillus daqui]|uniref:hypothetical protein n=1 Tax=Solibacillus daqui TaxID=2912187 RepID=UPI0023670A5E|nr:hypothetical protein [Solibacillus daqui]
MKKIEFIENGYEIVVTIPNETDSPIIEADAYYKDFDKYRILILADSEEQAVEMATKELLAHHPLEQVIRDY